MRLAVVVLIMAVLMGCKNDLAEVNEIFDPRSTEVERLEDIDITYSDSAIVKLRIRAAVHLRYEESGSMMDEFSDGVQLDFLEGDRVTGWLTADWAKRDNKRRETTMRGRVTLYNANGQKLQTTQMLWTEKDGKLSSDQFVRITQDDQVLQGYGFVTDEEFSSFEITSLEGQFDVVE